MQTIITPTPTDQSQYEQTETVEDALVALHQRTVDSVAGFSTMVEKAEPEFRDVARRFQEMHQKHAAILAQMLQVRGVAPESTGTIMGSINKAVVRFRSLFDEIDGDVMDQVRSGEEWILKAFDTAIASLGDDASVARLHEMRAELTELLAKTSNLG